MLFDDINKDEMENISVANFLAIVNKAYNLYLNQEIEDLDITTEQIPFLIELDKTETISKKDLAKYLFLSDRNTARGLIELYRAGIIDKKPLNNEVSAEKEDNIKKDDRRKDNIRQYNIREDNINYGRFGNWRNTGNKENRRNKVSYGFNNDLEISLTPYGKKLVSKIKEIDAKWEELIYKNLDDSDKDEIIKSMKDLAISSLKTTKDADIFGNEAEVSKARKIYNKLLSRIFSLQHHGSQSVCHSRGEGYDFDDFEMERIAHMHPRRFRELNPDHLNHMAYLLQSRKFY